ncbi:MAG: Lrp/AsnC family transcriptional regulator [Luteimonas sp.]|nr:Lrp/AsnC family transcriptional regulator [Luteimonas sp.]
MPVIAAPVPFVLLLQEGDAMKTRDAIDDKLIALLQDNARLSTVALAKAVGLSRSTVQERLQRLEQAGVIAQYTVRLGSGGDPLQAWLFLRYADGFSCDDVMPLLAGLPQVQLVHSVAGEIDLLVLVQAGSPGMLADLRERIAAFKGVDDVTTVPVLRATLDRR